MTTLEQKLLNAANVVIDAAANLVAAKNPAYDPLITLASGVVDQINQQVNPSAPAAATTIAAAAGVISSAVAPISGAAATVGSGSSTATQKASALGLIVGDVESVAASIKNLF